jgi:hypothetical protein
MYPFSNRWRWYTSNRYAHLLAAYRHIRIADSLVQERLAALARWSRVRTGVAVVLSFGAAAAGAGLLVRLLPEIAVELVSTLTAITGALAGVLALAYLAITRLLGIIEADILALGILDRKS